MRNLKRNFARDFRRDDEMTVQPGLALTPRDMDKMLQQNIPISTANLPDEQFFDGTTDASFYIPPEERRGIDPADCWEIQCDARNKFKKARKESGENPQLPKTD